MMNSIGIPQPETQAEVSASDARLTGELTTTAHHIALLNGMLPRGFRFDLAENCRKLSSLATKTAKRRKPVARHIHPIDPERRGNHWSR